MVEHDQFPQSRDDAALDRHLLALKRFTPKPGFQDQVMARVRVRASALVRFPERSRAVATPRRLWWGSGLAAAGATGWTVALMNWLSNARLESIGTWMVAQIGQPLTTAATQAGAQVTGMLNFYAHAAYSAAGNALFPLIAASMLLPVLSSWGLYQTMKQPRGKRIAAYAAH